MPSTTTSGTKSGIITSTGGERHIPASVRADGSTRKEIKIRPGYRPPEDVEVYKNRTAEAWKTRGAGAGVPGAAVVNREDLKPSSNKNAKRREARKRAKAAGDDSQDGVEGNEPAFGDGNASQQPNGAGKSIGPDDESWRKEEKDADPAIGVEAEKEKQARNLKKKLRQARELREKNDNGENLLPEQFAKVIKINELIRQLDSLGFDQEGEPKH
ncbi:MAG: hypothetical protein Q9216_001068 [Gyalolechia sp. 2 TL-2023]